MKSFENAVESVHRQHLADSGIVIQDRRAGIFGMIVVAHANVRPTDKGCITEDDPRFLRSGEKALPENVKSHRHIRVIAGEPGFRNPAVQEARLARDRKSTRLNSSHDQISYAVFCLKKKKKTESILDKSRESIRSIRHT